MLSGCASAPRYPTIHAAIDTEITLHYREKDYTGHLCYVNKATASLTFSSPESLAGFSFHRAGGKDSLSLGSLLCKGGTLLPDSNVPAKEVFSAMDTLSDPALCCTGSAEDGHYTFAFSDPEQFTVTTDSAGVPLTLQTPALTLTIGS